MATALPSQMKSKASQPGQSGLGLPLQVVQRKDTAAMESLMAGDVDVNAVTSTGMTPLIRAALNGHLGTLRALLTRGAAVNQKRNDGFTALALAAFFGHEHVVRELLSHGADIKAQDKTGSSAEMWADARSLTTISDLLREIRERSAEMVSSETLTASEPILPEALPQPLPTAGVNDIDSPKTVAVSEPILPQPSRKPSVTARATELDSPKTVAVLGPILPQPSPQPLPTVSANDIDSRKTVAASELIVTPPSPQPLPTASANDIASPKAVEVSEPIVLQPQPSLANKANEVPDETTLIRTRTETLQTKAVVEEDLDDPWFPEGSIRRVGGGRSATTSPMNAIEDRVNSGAAFSPFSAVVDRLTASWKQLALVMLVVMLLSGLVTLGAMKVIRKAKPSPAQAIAESAPLPVESEKPASVPNEPAAPLPDAQPKASLEASTGQGNADVIQRRPLDDASAIQASHSNPAVLRDLPGGRAADSETKRRAEKPKAQFSDAAVSEVARAPHTTRRRSESTGSDSDVRNRVTRASEPAAIKIVSEPPAKQQVGKASSSKEILAQPTTPLEGSSTKRKVIQWP